jgi:hypothetical protein
MDLITLFEMDWYDKSPLTAVLRRNRGRWVHFSQGAPNRDMRRIKQLPEPTQPSYYDRRKTKQYQRDLAAVKRKNATHAVPKLGINPKSIWSDPKGIYFYPVDFLLSGFERIMSGNQHGLAYPYYYIVDLNLNDPNGVNLGTITWPQIEAIAKRNGWFDQMQAFRQLPADDQQKKLFSYARPDLPGSFFWHFIDRMVKDQQMTWSRAYRGISFIRDPNLSIIHNNEPDQVLVLDPRIIKIVEMGENNQPVKAGGGSDSIEQWMHVLLTIIRQVRGEYGGDLTWMKKKPTLSFAKGSGKFALSIAERSSQMEVGLNLSITYGRASDSMHIGYDSLNKQNVEQVVQSLRAKIEQIAARKSDLLFTPLISIAAGKQLMIDQITDRLGLSIGTTIYNSDQRYSSVNLHGEIQREIDRVTIKTTCHLSLTPDKMSASCNVWAGNQYLITAMSDYQEEYTNPSAMLASVALKVRENFDNMANYYAPKTGTRSTYDRNARFSSDKEFVAFKGWVVIKSGLSLDGELRQQFAAEVAAFEEYPDKRNLLADIAYVLNSKY